MEGLSEGKIPKYDLSPLRIKRYHPVCKIFLFSGFAFSAVSNINVDGFSLAREHFRDSFAMDGFSNSPFRSFTRPSLLEMFLFR